MVLIERRYRVNVLNPYRNSSGSNSNLEPEFYEEEKVTLTKLPDIQQLKTWLKENSNTNLKEYSFYEAKELKITQEVNYTVT